MINSTIRERSDAAEDFTSGKIHLEEHIKESRMGNCWLILCGSALDLTFLLEQICDVTVLFILD